MRLLIVALAAPAEMTDRGQFCRLTIIVLLITAMTFTGKPLQSHYLLLLNSGTKITFPVSSSSWYESLWIQACLPATWGVLDGPGEP